MRRATVDALIRGVTPEAVYDAIVRYERYPALAPHLQATTVHRGLPEPVGSSSWELHFRSGLLRWTEEEHFDRERLLVTFAQVTGDFDEFTGQWALRAEGADTDLHFHADFDFGIPSMAGILDPIAERVIRETVAWVLVGTFDDVRLDEPVEAPGAPVRGTAS